MSHQIQYNDFPTFLRKYFPYKVQKISLNAGFTCPNRDGTKGWGGCTYCNNQTLIRTTVGRKSQSLPNWRKGSVSLPINIRK